MASPFGCRSGHISAFAEATLPRDGQVGEGVSPALDAQTEKHNDPRRSTYSPQQRSQTVPMGLLWFGGRRASARCDQGEIRCRNGPCTESGEGGCPPIDDETGSRR